MSRLSVVSTTASENQTLQISPVVDTTLPPPGPSVPLERPVPILEAMDVDTSALRTTISEEPPSEVAPREPSETVRAPSVIMEPAFVPPPPPVPAPVPVPALVPVPASAPAPPVVPAPTTDVPTIPVLPPTTGTPAITVPPTTTAVPAVPVLPPATADIFNLDGIQPKRVVQGPDGQIIVEVLDSPLIRKQMTKLKKAERKRLMEQQRQEEVGTVQPQAESEKEPSEARPLDHQVVPVVSAVAGPSRLALGPDGQEAESELSSLSDLGSEALEAREKEVYTPVVSAGRGRRRGPPRRMSVTAALVPEDLGVIKESQVLEGGTLGTFSL